MVSRKKYDGPIADGWTPPERRIRKRKPLHAPKGLANESQACSISGCEEPAGVLVGATFGVPYCSGHDPTRE